MSTYRSNLKQTFPTVVVLDITYAGYGILRSLVPYNVPVVGFHNDALTPEVKSKLWRALIRFSDESDLLEKLIIFSKKQENMSILFITGDRYVEFFIKYRSILQELYRIDYPKSQCVDLLLNKDRFSNYARKNNILIPRSGVVNCSDNLNDFKEEYNFPVVLKPFTKSKVWMERGLSKIFYVSSYTELKNLYLKIKEIERNVIIQEWVPGPDSNVIYCLTYFNNQHQCVSVFTGVKLRQWSVGTGSTATTQPVKNQWVQKKTTMIFSTLNYAGFGSIEFKRHDINGKYYLMEPTVGRPDQQEFVATLNGVNIPLIAYNSLTGINIQVNKPSISPVIYIDEWAEICSSAIHIKRKLLTIKQWYQSIRGNRAYRYWNKDDKKVFIASMLITFYKLVKKLVGSFMSRKINY